MTVSTARIKNLAKDKYVIIKIYREQRSRNLLYQELSFQDNDVSVEADDSGEITGSLVHPGEYASSGKLLYGIILLNFWKRLVPDVAF